MWFTKDHCEYYFSHSCTYLNIFYIDMYICILIKLKHVHIYFKCLSNILCYFNTFSLFICIPSLYVFK